MCLFKVISGNPVDKSMYFSPLFGNKHLKEEIP